MKPPATRCWSRAPMLSVGPLRSGSTPSSCPVLGLDGLPGHGPVRTSSGPTSSLGAHRLVRHGPPGDAAQQQLDLPGSRLSLRPGPRSQVSEGIKDLGERRAAAADHRDVRGHPAARRGQRARTPIAMVPLCTKIAAPPGARCSSSRSRPPRPRRPVGLSARPPLARSRPSRSASSYPCSRLRRPGGGTSPGRSRSRCGRARSGARGRPGGGAVWSRPAGCRRPARGAGSTAGTYRRSRSATLASSSSCGAAAMIPSTRRSISMLRDRSAVLAALGQAPDQHRVRVAVRGALGGHGELGERHVGDVPGDQADGGGGALHQAPGHGVGPVAEPLGDRHDPRGGLAGHPDVAAVQHLARRLEADAGLGRHFLDRDVPPGHSVLPYQDSP